MRLCMFLIKWRGRNIFSLSNNTRLEAAKVSLQKRQEMIITLNVEHTISLWWRCNVGEKRLVREEGGNHVMFPLVLSIMEKRYDMISFRKQPSLWLPQYSETNASGRPVVDALPCGHVLSNAKTLPVSWLTFRGIFFCIIQPWNDWLELFVGHVRIGFNLLVFTIFILYFELIFVNCFENQGFGKQFNPPPQ